jgi:uncharacterized protein YecE (DUF72 family)
VFYPLTKTDELKFYSRYFNAVEINSTFYRPCNPKTAESWARRTPDDFEFTVKVWQQFTHKKDMWLTADIDEFKKGIAPLAESGKLGCILFQFPSSFRATPETQDRLKALLAEFADFNKVVELRHRSWTDNLDILVQTGTTPAFIDEPKFRDSIRQEIRPVANVIYVRFHGRKADKWWRHEHRNERYDYLYSKEEIRPYAIRLKEIVTEKAIQKAYVFFNNHPNAKAVANAVMMRAELDMPVETELPEPLVEKYPELTPTGTI